MEDKSFISKSAGKFRNSISLKLIVIGFLILLFLIPISMIESLVYERQNRKFEAINEVSSSWGNPQTIAAPFITVPYYEFTHTTDEYGKSNLIRTKHKAYFLPEELLIDGEILPEIRYRGIYDVVVYNSKMKISGKFAPIDFNFFKIEDKNVLWDEAEINIGISDLRSIKQSVKIQIQDTVLAFNPGLSGFEVAAAGISASLDWRNDKALTFSVDLDLNGSSSIDFLPLGKQTNVKLTSTWENPKFMGAFLPETREINKDGFVSEWKVLHLNRNYPQSFLQSAGNISESSFGVSLLLPVDEYQKNMRAGKYAVLIIALTFVVFFFMQVLNKIMIHPIQYIIVGLALMVFYSLLIAISEQLSFNWAYLISSVAIIGMVGLYVKAILKSNKLASLLTGVMVLLYLFIFTIIQLQDYSLLFGSIGLFIVLGVIMYLSRNIDWYNIDFDDRN